MMTAISEIDGAKRQNRFVRGSSSATAVSCGAASADSLLPIQVPIWRPRIIFSHCLEPHVDVDWKRVRFQPTRLFSLEHRDLQHVGGAGQIIAIAKIFC